MLARDTYAIYAIKENKSELCLSILHLKKLFFYLFPVLMIRLLVLLFEKENVEEGDCVILWKVVFFPESSSLLFSIVSRRMAISSLSNCLHSPGPLSPLRVIPAKAIR
mmetsp:Transcript_11308/g.15521  ORF Transcript_11308/g.15521 Transcript_11308/m.15521 type:complete len:108 (-) Transcript_11308:900-1223(-)